MLFVDFGVIGADLRRSCLLVLDEAAEIVDRLERIDGAGEGVLRSRSERMFKVRALMSLSPSTDLRDWKVVSPLSISEAAVLLRRLLAAEFRFSLPTS